MGGWNDNYSIPLDAAPGDWYLTPSFHEGDVDNQLGRPLEVEVRDSLEKAMKILKQKMSKEGILQEVKRRRFYEKPSVKRKRKMREARKRRRREAKRRGTK